MKVWLQTVARYFCVLILLLSPLVSGRKTSGSFTLSGVDSEYVLHSFVLSSYAKGWFDLHLSSKAMYEDEHNLKLLFVTDKDWSKFQKAPTCSEKVRFARQSFPVNFEYVKVRGGDWKSFITTNLNQETDPKPHYWYFVIADCSLEYKNPAMLKVPKITYELSVFNDVSGKKDPKATPKEGGGSKLTHISGDEIGIKQVHMATLALSGLIALYMIVRIFNSMVSTKSVHLALIVVMAAAALDSSSSLFELVHLVWYERNGYGWYLFDALASHLEAMCDALVALLLLAIASGWTMSSDVVQVSSMQSTWVQRMTNSLRNPIAALFALDLAGILVLTTIALHVILAQWGRTYDDDFDSYHDFEHLPGKILMTSRILLGLLLVAACMQSKASCPSSLTGFYTLLSLVGTLWFQGLPLVTWVCNRVMPNYLKHPTVHTYGAICQTSSMMCLAWLVTSHSTHFHQMSRVTQQKEDSLSDSLTMAPETKKSSWSMGKSKIRLD